MFKKLRGPKAMTLSLVLILAGLAFTPTLAWAENPKIVKVSAGWNSSFAITDTGDVWTWGKTQDGGNSYSTKPRKITTLSNIIDVQMCQKQVLALNKDGEVYSWGSSPYKALGRDDGGYIGYWMTPTKVSGLINVSKIVAGDWYSFALCNDGKVYAWGRNNTGQLGIGSKDGTDKGVSLTEVTALAGENIIDIADGNAIDSDGGIYQWGSVWKNDNGSSKLYSIETPEKMPTYAIDNAKTIENFRDTPIILTKDNNIFAWESNEYGQCGPKVTLDHKVYYPWSGFSIEIANPAKVGMSLLVAYCINTSGRVYTWGNNTNGSLGQNISGGATKSAPTLLPAFTSAKVVDIAGGYAHTVTCDAQGRVYTWGYNDEGQLGDGTRGFATSRAYPKRVAGFGIDPPTYGIAFHANGGSYSNSKASYIEGESFVFGEPVKVGHAFAGWYANASFTGVAVTGIKASDTGAKNFYAKWTANKFKIKFNANGGKGSMATQNMTYGAAKKSLSKNKFKAPKGKKFAGWATSKKGKVIYKNLAKVQNLSRVNGATVHLYAKWKKQ